jgi:uncharacterized repeat protein (TIGR01451 family)
MKKRFPIIGLSAIATAVALSFHTPVIAALQQAGTAISQSVQRQPVMKVDLTAERKVFPADDKAPTWKALDNAAPVQTGDVIRYQLNGINQGKNPIKRLVFTQPIPKGTEYIIKSANATKPDDVRITFSIDQGKQFTEKPMVRVMLADGTMENQPAPVEAYTHVRWEFAQMIEPGTPINASYEVKVR